MSAAKIVSLAAAVRPEGASCIDSSRHAQQCRAASTSFRCSGLDKLKKEFPVQSVACVRGVPVVRPISCKAKNLGQDEFEEAVLKSDLPVLVDFWAGWCGPCKLVAPIIDWASEEYDGKLKVYKVETDKSPQLVEKYRLYGLPTLILFKDGKQVRGSRREGAISKDKLKAYLDELLQSAAA